jgi:hypothetical protein
MILYHITDSYLEEKILRDGLIGDPVVYLGKSPDICRDVRKCQIKLGERSKEDGVTIFRVNVEGFEILHDRNTKWEGAPSWVDTDVDVPAWMVYADIEPERLEVFYSD